MQNRHEYDLLLQERVRHGLKLADAVSHDLTHSDSASESFLLVGSLERRLEGFQRYRYDRLILMAAEDRRFHWPFQPPREDPPCRFCLGVTVAQLRAVDPHPHRRAA